MATGERETRRNRGRERRRWRERGWGERRIASSHLATEQPTHARTHRRTLFFTYSPSIFSIKKQAPGGIAKSLQASPLASSVAISKPSRATIDVAHQSKPRLTKATRQSTPSVPCLDALPLTRPELPITVAQEGSKTRGLHYQGQPPLTGSMEACYSRGHRQRG